MIGSLRGALIERDIKGEVLIEVAGVGWRVSVTPATAAALGELGEEVFVHVHHHIREGDQQLFGFLSGEERRMFIALISAHGVGPSLGLAILAVHGPGELARVLTEEDVAALCLVPGVGKKTAARLVVDLKSKIVDIDLDLVDGAVGGGGGVGGGATNDVREALATMGFAEEEIRHVITDLDAQEGAEAMLKHALKRLAALRKN